LSELARVFYGGYLGFEKNYEKAFHFWRIAANRGHYDSLINAAIMLYDNHGIALNYKKALYYLKKAANFRSSGLPFTGIGVFYENGWVVQKDYTKALKWYELGAEAGDVHGMNNYSSILTKKDAPVKDFAKARRWLQEATNKGHPTSLNTLGYIYDKGMGVEVDFKKAFDCYKKACDLGDGNGANNVADMFLTGRGVHVDYGEAFRYFKLAVERNSSIALATLGFMYMFGMGVEKSIQHAILMFEQSCNLNNSFPYLLLGIIYSDGIEVQKNEEYAQRCFDKGLFTDLVSYDEFIEWMEQIEEKKHPDKLALILGMIFLRGYMNSAIDSMKARKYLQRAYEHGSLWVKMYL